MKAVAGRPGMRVQAQERVASKEKCKEEDTPLTLTIEKVRRTITNDF